MTADSRDLSAAGFASASAPQMTNVALGPPARRALSSGIVVPACGPSSKVRPTYPVRVTASPLCTPEYVRHRRVGRLGQVGLVPRQGGALTREERRDPGVPIADAPLG